MLYLIEQYTWFLVAAFVIGVVIGWWTFDKPTKKATSQETPQ